MYKIKGFKSTNLDEVTKQATDFINSPEMKGYTIEGWALNTSASALGSTLFIIVISYFDDISTELTT
jgi:hypothetical protein